MWLPNFRFDVHFAAFIVGALSCLHVSSAEQRPPATVEEKERIVEASPPPSAPWVPAVVGKDLLLRERVRTGELSRATVRLSNEHLVRVNANSQLVIVPSLIAGKPLGLDLQKGEIYLHSRGVPMELGLRTPSVTGTPHGTEFRVRVEENGTTTFTMFDGEVELENAHGKLHIGINELWRAEYRRPRLPAESCESICRAPEGTHIRRALQTRLLENQIPCQMQELSSEPQPQEQHRPPATGFFVSLTGITPSLRVEPRRSLVAPRISRRCSRLRPRLVTRFHL